VGADDAGTRQQLFQLGGLLHDPARVVVQVEDLTLARDFAQDRLGHQVAVVFHDIGLNRPAIVGRFLEDADVADAGHRHVQRTGDRCRAQGQDIHIRPKGLQLFLVVNPETLLFVNDQKAQFFQAHIL